MTTLVLNRHQYLELEKLALGAFAPLGGFMTEAEFQSVVSTMRLPNGAVFPLPVVLDVSDARALRRSDQARLMYEGQEVGELTPQSVYRCDRAAVARQVYGTDDTAHPGVAYFFRLKEWFVGGPVTLLARARCEFSDHELTPQQTRAEFARRGWKTVVGFQTRNVPHRAHEYLLRLALEFSEGLFIQPLVGFKQRGDYTPKAILTAYRTLIDRFLPKDRVVLGVLSTAMRYAGPREAVFHAIIRRNYGCTHFIVGRDHAGVGNYYGRYAAHELTRQFDGQLGIEVLRCSGPYHCTICGGIVTERSCPHGASAPEAIRHISGTSVRALLGGGSPPAPELIRPEVLQSITALPCFIEEEEEASP
ncbi:MAG: sulfate adenylyltransferase [Candidatus Omnitrophica bacterium]|nr:sulfate adenylyltransferase [Candidatus Omnitrophota bacterium]